MIIGPYVEDLGILLRIDNRVENKQDLSMVIKNYEDRYFDIYFENKETEEEFSESRVSMIKSENDAIELAKSILKKANMKREIFVI
ncbi:hypothetical protein B7C51_24930 (plasmid) [Paenibacillus larvae subsp. pulvifaciens]|uniref:Uncharacterized protein n=1 Tax=Paenibacillus larvae subsp. pulvifaciens TaxID=1477 RepID=A0A1V0V044_9BACL|nr:hypothetical protein [Paenibacillus larvae]ARF70721.1 hypothetical protein B7C51_24930 [Paenibacillus larvae subsp. pulvifaciens]